MREHRRFAFGFGWAMVTGGLACMVHGLVPALFTDKGSRTVRALHGVIEHRERLPEAAPRREGLPVLLFLALAQRGGAVARRRAFLGGAAAQPALARLHPRLLVERGAGRRRGGRGGRLGLIVERADFLLPGEGRGPGLTSAPLTPAFAGEHRGA